MSSYIPGAQTTPLHDCKLHTVSQLSQRLRLLRLKCISSRVCYRPGLKVQLFGVLERCFLGVTRLACRNFGLDSSPCTVPAMPSKHSSMDMLGQGESEHLVS